MINTQMRINQGDFALTTKRIVLDLLAGEYRGFLSVVSGVARHRFHERWLDGNWGVSEIVALHSGWLEKLNEALALATEGVPIDQVDWMEVERWEEAFYGRGSGERRARVLRDLKQAFQRFITTASRLPAKHYGENGQLTRMLTYVGICKFKLHASLIEAWTEGRIKASRSSNVAEWRPVAA
jgi:hypothetical protein